jgi:hypothetical protein
MPQHHTVTYAWILVFWRGDSTADALSMSHAAGSLWCIFMHIHWLRQWAWAVTHSLTAQLHCDSALT